MKGGHRAGAGRKKGFAALEGEKARELIAKKLSAELGPIIDIAIKQAKSGDRYAREWLIERAYGKVKEDIELQNIPVPIMGGRALLSLPYLASNNH